MKEWTEKYNGEDVSVVAKEVNGRPDRWMPHVLITGTEHVVSKYQTYPQDHFATAEEALSCGKRVAKWIVDHPGDIEKEIA